MLIMIVIVLMKVTNEWNENGCLIPSDNPNNTEQSRAVEPVQMDTHGTNQISLNMARHHSFIQSFIYFISFHFMLYISVYSLYIIDHVISDITI